MTISITSSHLHGIEKLEGASNYATWKNAMEMILIREDLWEVTSGESKAPGPWYEPVLGTTATGIPAIVTSGTRTERTPTAEEAKERLDFNRLHRRAYATIALAVSEQCRVHIAHIKDPVAMWKKLQELFETQGYTARFLALKDAVNTTLERSGSVEAYIDAIKTSGQLLEDMGHAMPKWMLTSLLLFNLGEAYDSFIAITLRTNRKGEPDFDDLVSSLIEEERRHGGKDNAIALAIRSKPLTGRYWSTSTTKH